VSLNQLAVNGTATITGLATIRDASGPVTLTFDGPGGTGNYRGINYTTNGVTRWFLIADGAAESGSNVGSNFAINRYADSGTMIDQPLTINRATGVANFGQIPTAPTPGKQTNTQSVNLTQVATMQALTQRGLAAGAFTTTSGSVYPGFGNWSGGVIRMTAAGTIFLPGDATGGTYTVLNTSSATVGVAGVDSAHSQIPTGGAAIYAGDGSGSMWCIASSGGGVAAANGWQMMPGGVVMQWGKSGSVGANSATGGAVTFPLAFPANVWSIVLTPAQGMGTGGMSYYYIYTQSLTGFTIFNGAPSAGAYNWIAFGN
jgi:hypothetical protein